MSEIGRPASHGRSWSRRALLRSSAAVLAGGTFHPLVSTDDSIGLLHFELERYRNQLDQIRRRNGGTSSLPGVRWFLFGCGNRPGLLYQDGRLRSLVSGQNVHEWDVADELIVPPLATVMVKTRAGRVIRIVEDEKGVWTFDGETRRPICERTVSLPTFSDHPLDLVLRALHHEILTSVVGGRPLPNRFVYDQPRYRDAALAAMVLEKTGNLGLIRDWIMGLTEPLDPSNKGGEQPDNLGQALFLIARVSDRDHPLVKPILEAADRFRAGGHIRGNTRPEPHPVYQTAWLKFGLRALGLADPYRIPDTADAYRALVWWAFPDELPASTGPIESADFPYLTWASDHALGTRLGQFGDRLFPLTWESNAHQARYAGMAAISPEYEKRRTAAPHSWHAAEMFLRLWDDRATYD